MLANQGLTVVQQEVETNGFEALQISTPFWRFETGLVKTARRRVDVKDFGDTWAVLNGGASAL